MNRTQVHFLDAASVKVNQFSADQAAVAPVVVDDDLVFGWVWSNSNVAGQVGFFHTY